MRKSGFLALIVSFAMVGAVTAAPAFAATPANSVQVGLSSFMDAATLQLPGTDLTNGGKISTPQLNPCRQGGGTFADTTVNGTNFPAGQSYTPSGSPVSFMMPSSATGDNAVCLGLGVSGKNSVVLPVPMGNYSNVYLLAAVGNGPALVDVTPIYAEGAGTPLQAVVPDWCQTAIGNQLPADASAGWNGGNRVTYAGATQNNLPCGYFTVNVSGLDQNAVLSALLLTLAPGGTAVPGGGTQNAAAVLNIMAMTLASGASASKPASTPIMATTPPSETVDLTSLLDAATLQTPGTDLTNGGKISTPQLNPCRQGGGTFADTTVNGTNFPAGSLYQPSGSPVAFQMPASATGNNAVCLGLGVPGKNSVVVPVPTGHYTDVYLLAAVGNGPALLNVTPIYSDGTGNTIPAVVPDWCQTAIGHALPADASAGWNGGNRLTYSGQTQNNLPCGYFTVDAAGLNKGQDLTALLLTMAPGGTAVPGGGTQNGTAVLNIMAMTLYANGKSNAASGPTTTPMVATQAVDLSSYLDAATLQAPGTDLTNGGKISTPQLNPCRNGGGTFADTTVNSTGFPAGQAYTPSGSPVAFQMPSSATGNNAVCLGVGVPARNTVVIPVAQGHYTDLYMLASVGNGPALVNVTPIYAEGTGNPLPVVVPDWCQTAIGHQLPADASAGWNGGNRLTYSGQLQNNLPCGFFTEHAAGLNPAETLSALLLTLAPSGTAVPGGGTQNGGAVLNIMAITLAAAASGK